MFYLKVKKHFRNFAVVKIKRQYKKLSEAELIQLNKDHNCTLSTLAMLSSFFGQPIITSWLRFTPHSITRSMTAEGIKILSSGECRMIRDCCIFRVNDLEVSL